MESTRERLEQELKTVLINLENAQRWRDWAAVDRASQRLAQQIFDMYAQDNN